MRKRTFLIVVATGMAMAPLVIVPASRADTVAQGDGYAWGDEKKGIKMGVQVEQVDGSRPDLFTFTTAVTNCSDQPVTIAAGDTWNGPMRPQYVIGDGKHEWTVAPPHVCKTTQGITHVPLPMFLSLKPKETKVVHRSIFVPSVPAGKWKVYARLRPSMDLRSEHKHKRLKREGVWRNGTLVSGSISLPIEKGKPCQETAPVGAAAKVKLRATLGDGHTSTVLCVVFSPDGKRLASASADKSIKLWDAASGRNTATLQGHTGVVTFVAFSPDGKTLASASSDKTIKLWNVNTGANTVTLEKQSASVFAMVFHPKGALMVCYDKKIKLWDLATGKSYTTVALDGHSALSGWAAFSSDRKMLAAGRRDKTIRVWDVASGKATATLPWSGGGGVGILSVAFSPDGKILATGASAANDQNLKLWDLASGKSIATIPGHRGSFGATSVNAVAFSPDGKTLASAAEQGGNGGGQIRLWDVAARKNIAVLSGHKYAIPSLAFSPDGKTLASGSLDMSIKLWDSVARDK